MFQYFLLCFGCFVFSIAIFNLISCSFFAMKKFTLSTKFYANSNEEEEKDKNILLINVLKIAVTHFYKL